jgi:hypothetical protein
LVAGLGGREAESPSPATSDAGTYYVLFNDQARSVASAIKPDIKGVISSALQTMMGANMEATLLGAYVAAQANGYQFKLMNIPASVELGPNSFDFDPEVMKALFEKGREIGRNPSSWVAAPSPGQNASPWLINLLSELRRGR